MQDLGTQWMAGKTGQKLKEDIKVRDLNLGGIWTEMTVKAMGMDKITMRRMQRKRNGPKTEPWQGGRQGTVGSIGHDQ